MEDIPAFGDEVSPRAFETVLYQQGFLPRPVPTHISAAEFDVNVVVITFQNNDGDGSTTDWYLRREHLAEALSPKARGALTQGDMTLTSFGISSRRHGLLRVERQVATGPHMVLEISKAKLLEFMRLTKEAVDASIEEELTSWLG